MPDIVQEAQAELVAETRELQKQVIKHLLQEQESFTRTIDEWTKRREAIPDKIKETLANTNIADLKAQIDRHNY